MQKVWLSSYPEGTPADIDADEYPSLVAMFEESCRRFADRPAYHNLGVTLTYRDLDRLSAQFAAYLQGLGLARGDRVALMLPNLLQYPVALFGVLRAGLAVVNTNPLYTPRELRHQLQDSGARCIVVLENFARVLQEVRADTAVEHIVTTCVGDLAPQPKRALVNFVVRRVKRMVPRYDLPDAVGFRTALARGAQRVFHPVEIAPGDLAFLQYTGGTTGVAKGAMLTHRNMVANLLQVAAFWKNLIVPGEEVVIAPLPLYHVFSLTCCCLVFMHHGGLNVLITNPRDIPAFVKELRKLRMTMIVGVNTLYAALMNHPGFAQLDFSRLKLGAAGGMALHPSVAEKWNAITGKPLVEGYGLTEASPVVTCNSYLAPQVGTVGLPLPSTEISLRDERQRGGAWPGRRAVRARTAGDARLLAAARRDGQGDLGGRVAANRRHRDDGRVGLPAHRRPQEGHDHRLGLQGVPERDRERVHRAFGRTRMRLRRRARSALRPGREGVRRAAREPVGHRRAAARAFPRATDRLQGAQARRVPQHAAEDQHRQDPAARTDAGGPGARGLISAG